MLGTLKSIRAVLLALVVAASALAVGATASAQTSELVGTPLTTKRLERLLRVYVSPTDEEASAIDRLHEAYLDKFRAELDPEILAVGKSMSGRAPSKQEFEKFLRDLDRVQTKIAEADNAFLDSAANLVAEPRRAGMQRIRESRERQRLLVGFARAAPMMFGGGGSFVDLADLLARDEFVRQVPETARDQFDGLLRSQEQRTLAQVRTYSESLMKAMSSFYDIAMEEQAAEAGAKGDDGEQAADPAAAGKAAMERMQRMMERMREIGAGPRKAIASNLDSNRAAVRQFASILPERTFHRLRRDIARRSMGMMGALNSMAFTGQGGEQAVDPSVMVARLKRDPTVAPEVRVRLDEIELAWWRETANASESLAEFTLALDMSTLYGGMGGNPSDPEGPMMKLTQMQQKSAAAEQTAYRAIRAAVGEEKGEMLFSTSVRPGESGDGGDSKSEQLLVPRSREEEPVDASPMTDDTAAAGSIAAVFNLSTAPRGWTPSELTKLFRAIGVPDSSLAVLEGVVEGWRKTEWDAKVVPIGESLSEEAMGVYGQRADGTWGRNADKAAKAMALRRQLIETVFAADKALCADLVGALGLEPDGPEVLALRLDRIALLGQSSLFSRRANMPAPSKLLLQGKITTEVARALLANSRGEWKALAEELPSLAIEALGRAERASSFTDTDDRDWTAYSALLAANAKEEAELARRIEQLYEGATARATDDPGLRSAIKRARLAMARPDIYVESESASRQLAAALRLESLTPDQRVRLEALQAEYEAVYEMLSERMAETPEPTGDGTDFRAEQERMEAEEKLRFQRNERTEKARSEARRILGDELASRIRGLVPNEADPSKSRATMRFSPFGGDED